VIGEFVRPIPTLENIFIQATKQGEDL